MEKVARSGETCGDNCNLATGVAFILLLN